MNKKVVLFDIDGTLFDPKLFLENFYRRLAEKFELENFDEDRAKSLYLESKINGYFKPELYLPKIAQHMKIKDQKVLEQLFWDQDSIDECLYQDSTVVEALGNNATPAIFSTGDSKYQKTKVERFKNLIGEENIFIFDDKLKAFKEVLDKFQGQKIYMVDDRLEILEEAKEIDPSVFAILVNREQFEAKSGKIDARIGNLYEILPFINE